ncbi:MAG: hypothetical protein G3M78_02845 [Candidatus Nitrohelix vancouverensis]|uniref:Transmembrane protein n=1 Tax=Candidatus Nitrohelix vancouverensis TaxID=2705534 RepID=A0A7T0C0M8_9BACT|nr:MAG: hypothetical protein G3M78_02845 [Candidatus Nitrohelix vancouverensis]
MVKVFEEFMSGLRSYPKAVQLWISLLAAFNGLVPLFFWDRFEAQVIFTAFIAGGMMGMALVGLQGFTRLLGLMHVFWFPLLVYLYTRLGMHPVEGAFGLYLRVVLAMNGISLVIDVADVFRYLRGERSPMKRA